MPHNFQTLVGQPALYADRGGGRRGHARPARPDGRLREPARRPGAPRGDRGRARSARPRPARLAGQDRGRHRLRARWRWRAGSSATRRAPPRTRGGWPTTPAQATREAREIIVGLRGDAERAARGRRCPDPARGGAALVGSGTGDPGRAGRSRTSASCTPWPRASSSGSCARRWATSTATPTRHASTSTCARLGCRAVLTVADDGRGLRGARDSAPIAPSAALRAHRHARARAARRRRARASSRRPGRAACVSAWVPIEAFAPRRQPQALTGAPDRPLRRPRRQRRPATRLAFRDRCPASRGNDPSPPRRRQRDRAPRHRVACSPRPRDRGRRRGRPTAARRSPARPRSHAPTSSASTCACR